MNWFPFGHKKPKPAPPPPTDPWPLTTELLRWTKDEPFTLEDACKGVQIWGMTGAGKSSSSGRLIATSYLKAGFGGLVLVAKPDETDTWRGYCRGTGRLDDLVVFSPAASWRFNPLAYEVQRPGVGAGLTENVLALFTSLAEVAGRGTASGGGQGREDEGYWKKCLQQLLRNAIDLLVIATGTVSVSDTYRVVTSAPTSYEQTSDPVWQERSFCWRLLQQAERADKRGYHEHDFQLVADYFLLEYPGLAEKTRSIVVSTFTSLADVLNRGVLRELFGTTTNVTPDDCLDGKVVVVDLAVKEFSELGTIAAVLWKTMYQKMVERRDVRHRPRPVFLFADELHLFTCTTDALFQTTARSARCCTVYLTQNLNNYLSAYKGPSGAADAKSLLGNLTTQIVHALADSDTATYLADLIGRRRQHLASGSVSHAPHHPLDDWLGTQPGQVSGGYSEAFEYDVQPAELGRQRTGGLDNQFLVDALVWRGGRPFRSTGRSYLWTTFRQHPGG